LGIAIRGDIVKKSYESMLKFGGINRPAIGIMISQLGSDSQREKILKENLKADQRFVPNTFGLLISKDDPIPENLKLWDTVIAINDNLINNGVELSDEIIKYDVGETITLTVIRKKKYIKVDVTLNIFEPPVDEMYRDRRNMGAPKK